MRWFGKSWGAPVCASDTFVAYEQVPAFCKLCIHCQKPILEAGNGLLVPYLPGEPAKWTLCGWHLNCFMQSVLP